MSRASGKQMPPGIVERHARTCPSRIGGECRRPCQPSYEAWAWDRREAKKIRKTFPTLAAAKAWRSDAVGDVRRGTLKAAPSITLREAAAAWLAGARDGSVRTRSGDVYKPAAIRGYERSLRLRILPELGPTRSATFAAPTCRTSRTHARAGARREHDPNALMPLRVIYRARCHAATSP